ncbi:hypothetical protein [Wenjunlia vitaminophila]|uniref:hypothetical protein n=1 Tax=Wenjunlia vitaminophila TaxID=76728 RepID=UPI000B30C44C|nr:hypothetical protein [Wenjunlia vitaminophila]
MAVPTVPPAVRRPAPSPGGPGDRPRRARRGFGLLGPRRNRHVVPADQTSGIALPVSDDGVVIGIDRHEQPAVLGLFRPEQFDVLLVGGLWTAQVFALRAVATGARVAVETGRGPVWQPMAQAAGGGMQCVSVHAVGQVAPQGPSVSNPVLVVRDCGARPPRSRLAAGPWQSVLTVLPYLGPTAPRLIASAALVGVQRVSPQEAAVVGDLLRLPQAEVRTLSTLGDNVTLWCTRRDRQLVMTQPTEAETALLGAPRRVD